jgi:hypothetical protein
MRLLVYLNNICGNSEFQEFRHFSIKDDSLEEIRKAINNYFAPPYEPADIDGVIRACQNDEDEGVEFFITNGVARSSKRLSSSGGKFYLYNEIDDSEEELTLDELRERFSTVYVYNYVYQNSAITFDSSGVFSSIDYGGYILELDKWVVYSDEEFKKHFFSIFSGDKVMDNKEVSL